MRTSVERLSSLPTGRISLFSRARRSLGWRLSGKSPTSSKNKVPPRAASKAPFRSEVAPVKLPLVCPNSSLSIKDSLKALQLTQTRGPVFRKDLSWRVFAISSFPAPEGPKINTGRSDRERLSICESVWAHLEFLLHREWLVSLRSRLKEKVRWVCPN